MYGLGYGALGPVDAAAAAKLSQGPQLGTIPTLAFSLVLAAIALSSACLGLAALDKARVIRSRWCGFLNLSAVEGDAM
jgi:hypothetical protein